MQNFHTVNKTLITSVVKVKVNQSRYRPGMAQRVPGSYVYHISWQRHREVVSLSILTHRPHLPPGNPPGTHFCLRLSRAHGHSAIGRIHASSYYISSFYTILFPKPVETQNCFCPVSCKPQYNSFLVAAVVGLQEVFWNSSRPSRPHMFGLAWYVSICTFHISGL